MLKFYTEFLCWDIVSISIYDFAWNKYFLFQINNSFFSDNMILDGLNCVLQPYDDKSTLHPIKELGQVETLSSTLQKNPSEK